MRGVLLRWPIDGHLYRDRVFPSFCVLTGLAPTMMVLDLDRRRAVLVPAVTSVELVTESE